MFTQPAFPSAASLKAADTAQTARLPAGTRNVHTFSTEPRYSPLPIRFKTRGLVFENNYTTVNLGGSFVLPPVGGLFVVPETVRSVDRILTSVLPAANSGPAYTAGPGANGFLVTARDLALPEHLASGRADRDVTWHVGSGNTAFWDPAILTSYSDGSGNDFNVWGHRVYSHSEGASDEGKLGHIFGHPNMQFGFEWTAFDPSVASDPNVSERYEVEVTFLLYPNPNWSRLAAGDNNDVF